MAESDSRLKLHRMGGALPRVARLEHLSRPADLGGWHCAGDRELGPAQAGLGQLRGDPRRWAKPQ